MGLAFEWAKPKSMVCFSILGIAGCGKKLRGHRRWPWQDTAPWRPVPCGWEPLQTSEPAEQESIIHAHLTGIPECSMFHDGPCNLCWGRWAWKILQEESTQTKVRVPSCQPYGNHLELLLGDNLHWGFLNIFSCDLFQPKKCWPNYGYVDA